MKEEESLTLPINGIKLASGSADIYPIQRDDLAIIELDYGTHVSGVFTQNKCCAAPVIIAKRHLSNHKPRYILINSGNANAGTGKQGIKNTIDCCQAIAALSGCTYEQVIPLSTGVIGEKLPAEKIIKMLPNLYRRLDLNSWQDVAKSMITTDTFPKVASEKIYLNNKVIHITGIAKGSGMIHPNMATMLAFIATDASIAKDVLDDMLATSVQESFNTITIDGDTSTNDTCLIAATNKSDNILIDDLNTKSAISFRHALTAICQTLAKKIVEDGEGATKFIEITVQNGYSNRDCLNTAYQIARSPLVKTAFYASDPNWGRILAAIGNAEISRFDIAKLSIVINQNLIFKNGQIAENYNEIQIKKSMLNKIIKLTIDLGVGEEQSTIWTTDFSEKYIQINSSYRS